MWYLTSRSTAKMPSSARATTCGSMRGGIVRCHTLDRFVSVASSHGAGELLVAVVVGDGVLVAVRTLELLGPYAVAA